MRQIGPQSYEIIPTSPKLKDGFPKNPQKMLTFTCTKNKLMKKLLLIPLFGLLLGGCAEVEPYKNAALTPEERAEDLLQRLTLEEKIGLMKDVSEPVERLGIPAYNWWSEALHGVGRAGLATVFPQSIAMAASFDDELVYRAFDAVSDEARAKFHESRRNGTHTRYRGLTFWTPNINIFRDPRWGRGQETYGEDPWLTSRMGVSVVKGLQGDGTAKYDKLHACAKHFAVHSGPEWNRHSFDARDIDARDLWETYLPAFKALVQDADVQEVMCAYNRFEGEPCCGSNRLLHTILRDLWGYKGLVVSDCSAIRDFFAEGCHETHRDATDASAAAVVSGTDVECGSSFTSLGDAVAQGLITEEQIDVSVRRLLRARFALGELDPDEQVSWSRLSTDVIDCADHRALALQMARETMTLLQNRNRILPLSRDLASQIVVMGPNAADSTMQWGNYNGFPAHTVTILEGIRAKVGDVPYVAGCGLVDNTLFESQLACVTSADGRQGFAATYWNNTELEGEPAARAQVSGPFRFDSSGATVFAPGVELTNFSARYEGTYRPTATGTITFTITGDDNFRLRVDGKELISWWEEQKRATRKCELAVEAGREYAIELDFRQFGKTARLQFDMGSYRTVTPAEAVAAAGDARYVIFVGGISPAVEGEEMKVDYPGFRGGDRTEIELPAVQREVIAALHRAGKRVIFVNCSGSAVALAPEAERCEAILQAWYPGQAGGTAVADVLFGDYNPAGRLPITFYKHLDQLPDFEDYSMRGRTYRYFRGEPLFPFGYGLSYTTFAYNRATLSAEKVKAGDPVQLTVEVANTGDRDGDEVVQIYLRRNADTEGPARSLRAFRRIHLAAGESKEVTFDLSAANFECFDPESATMRVLPGDYTLYYGGSSACDRSIALHLE